MNNTLRKRLILRVISVLVATSMVLSNLGFLLVPLAHAREARVPNAQDTPTETPTALPTATNTNIPEPTATFTSLPSAKPTEVPTASPTATELPTATVSPTLLPTATNTELLSPTVSASPSATASAISTPTATVSASALPTATPTGSLTATITETPTPTGSVTVTDTPTFTPTPTPTEPPPLNPAAAGEGAVFRARVVLKQPHDRQRLSEWGIELLEQNGTLAIVLADQPKLARLARLGFEPHQIDTLAYLAAAFNAETDGLSEISEEGLFVDHDLLLAQASVDSDGDGLTDTEEAWWCTDPNDVNSDSPEDPTETNPSDGDEVEAILNGVRAYGPPFALWPEFTPYNPEGTCPDGDYDGVPDFAEEFIIGTSQLRESSDKDKFDDGQELFGVTFCPAEGGHCGYGILPRAEDAAWVSANLPAWVLPPGDSPWVAAFPEPEVSIVPSSIVITQKTTITQTKGTTEGAEKTYGTAETIGTSTSQSETETWNNWQSVSTTRRADTSSSQVASDLFSAIGLSGSKRLMHGANVVIKTGAAIATCGQLTPASVGLAIGRCVASAAGAVHAIGEWVIDEIDSNKQIPGPENDLDLDALYPDGINIDLNINRCIEYGIPTTDPSCQEQSEGLHLASDFETLQLSEPETNNQNRGTSSGNQFGVSNQQSLTNRSAYFGSFPVSNFVPTNTETVGKEWGGARTTTTTQYEEHTISESSTNQFSESWSDATAANTAHAADLRFSYEITNSGTEYARQITSLIFNIYMGDNQNPIITYIAVGETGQIAQIENLFPGDSHIFTSEPIALTLNQMQAIDEGTTLRVVMEGITYGQDQAFYQDAINSSVLVAMEDGFDDSDEIINTFLVPVWDPSDTVQDMFKRYFPVREDEDGDLLAIWTPEFDTSSPPPWCQEPVTAPLSTTVFCKHALIGTSWWNLYLSKGLDYDGSFKNTLATPNSTVLVRILSDRDLDGYNDRYEIRLGTDPDDPASHPNPELLAGYTTVCSGNDCVALVSFLNTGNYDAYGVEAVMYSPDGLMEITNNTVGGSGRVPAGEQVVVGSRVLQPSLSGWSGDSEPYSSGYYLGGADRNYTFIAQSDGGIGQANPLVFDWSDGQGGTGTVDFGSGYQAPLPKDITLGLQIGFQSGTVKQGESFTVQAQTPRDTFQYTMNDPNAVDPVIVVSYNDPQGNHRFILPAASYLGTHDHLGDDLSGVSGQMIPDPGVQIASTSSSKANFVVNAPHPESIINGHLFVEYIDDNGNVLLEDDYQQTFETGPTIISVNLETTPPPAGTSILLAFFTDSQGNIIDSSARPLASLGPDPLPIANIVAAEWQIGPAAPQSVVSVPDPWDFGAVEAGTLLHARVTLGNSGVGELLYAITGYGDELSFSGAAAGTLAPTGTRTIDITLDTSGIPTGPFSRTLKVRTNDPNNAAIVINLAGTIMAPGGDATAYGVGVFQPWDQYVYVPGPWNMNDTIAFDHTILDEGARMHPLYLYDENGTTLRGVGEFGVDFSGQYAPASVFGTGVDGNLVVGSSQTVYTDNVRSAISVTASANQNQIQSADATGFSVDREVLIVQMQGADVGTYEFGVITAINSNTITLQGNIDNTYAADGNSKAQVLQVPHYNTITIQSGGVLTAHAWDGSTGGIVAFRASDSVHVESGGEISLVGLGYRGGDGGYGGAASQLNGIQGEGTNGTGTRSTAENAGGGGGGEADPCFPTSCGAVGSGGGGASHATAGADGTPDANPSGDGSTLIYGEGTLNDLLTIGSGGGGGGSDADDREPPRYAGDGGDGGGTAIIFSHTIIVDGGLKADGEQGNNDGAPDDHTGGGGGGAAGSIRLVGHTLTLNNYKVTASGGLGGAGRKYGGDGGDGRIRLEYTNLTGSTNPPASSQEVNFYSLSYGGVTGSGVDGDLVVSTGQTAYTDNTRSTLATNAASGQNQITLDNVSGFTVDREVLIIQIHGADSGTYEFATIDSINSNTLTLLYNLNNSYYIDAGAVTQVIQVPHYQNVTIENGAVLTAHDWDGSTGGVLVMRVSETLTINTGGGIVASGIGYRSGSGGHRVGNSNDPNRHGDQGEGRYGLGGKSSAANDSGGGGGRADIATNDGGGGGGGGSYATSGQNGSIDASHPNQDYGRGASVVYGTTNLSTAFFGGAGGGGASDDATNAYGGNGGDGGGIIMIFGAGITNNGVIDASGANGTNGTGSGQVGGGGGGGAGGSIRLVIRDATGGLIQAVGGLKGTTPGVGGNGGVGRISIEYCESFASNTNPAANTKEIDCYIINHPGGSPNTQLILPDEINNGASRQYILQYGQRGNDTTGGSQLFTARLPKTIYSSIEISALVERVTGSGSAFNFCLDIGNDGACDWTPPQQNFSGPARLDTNTADATALATALNAYIAAQGSSATDLLIPIRVNIDTPADIFLFDLIGTEGTALDIVASIPTIAPQNGAAPDNIAEGTLVDLSATVTNNGTVPAENFTIAFYDGDPAVDGTLIGAYFVESLDAGATLPAQVVEWNTTGSLGDKTIFVFADASSAIFESNKDNNKQTAPATVKMKPDLAIESLSVPDARAGETVQAQVTVGNEGEADVSDVTVNLYLGDDPDTWTLVNTSVPIDVAEGQTTSTQIAWTPPNAGLFTLSAMVDPTSVAKPDGDVIEADEDNNTASASAQAGWDVLTVDAGDDGTTDIPYDANAGYGWRNTEGEVVDSCGANPEQTYRQVGSAQDLEYRFDNLLPERRYHLYLTFATCSGERWVNIYVDGRLTGEFFPTDLALANPTSFQPTHINSTPQTVAVLLNPEDYVDGSIDLKLERADGFGGPLVNIIDLVEIKYCYIDSGPDETPWTLENGCGYDPTVPSDGYDGWGNLPEETLRFSEAGLVVYKFSGLDPARNYNFKVTFYEEDMLGREQLISFDTIPSETITLGPNPEYYVIQIPAAACVDGEVQVAIERQTPVLAAGIVSEVTLEEIARRYAGVPPEPEPTPTPTPTTEPEPVNPEVELKKFNALWSADHVDLSWSTKTEIDNAAFIIFRSTDSLAWTEIHTEPSTRPCGNFTGTTPVEYSYADNGVTEIGTYYYRLQYSGDGCGAAAGASMSAYMTPAELTPSFVDVPFDHEHWAYIETLWDGDYTAGCHDPDDPDAVLIFCPSRILNRAESAVWMLRGNFGTNYVPPPEPWDTFADDWSDWPGAEKWAEGMYQTGLSEGYNTVPKTYGAWDQFTRAQAAVFALRLKYGGMYGRGGDPGPPPATGTIFADMDTEYFRTVYWGTRWAEQAFLDGLVPECGWQDDKPLFCPEDEVDRSWAAYFIVIAKDMPMINLENND